MPVKESSTFAATFAASINPLDDRVLILPDDPEQSTPGGIIIPASARESKQRGTVVAVGPGRIEGGSIVPMTVRIGDVVLYERYAGTEIEVDGKDVRIVREGDILAVVR